MRGKNRAKVAQAAQSSLWLSYVEYNHGDALAASLAENEILQNLANVGYDGGVERIILTVELRFAFHASNFDMGRLLSHYLYFTIGTDTAGNCN